MSFDQNNNKSIMIHLGNYEEYFVLYMDNELSDDQMKMVDDFLLKHPDLRSEFDLLLNTKLPTEAFSLDKEELFAESMKLNAIDEELLLYIDNELPAEESKVVEIQIKSNPDYQLQHQVLMATKLDPKEVVSYPDKSELYRRTEKRAVGLWVRYAAAAVIMMAAAGAWYFSGNDTTTQGPSVAVVPVKVENKVKVEDEVEKRQEPVFEQQHMIEQKDLMANKASEKETGTEKLPVMREINKVQMNDDLIAMETPEVNLPEQRPVTVTGPSVEAYTTASLDLQGNNGILNRMAVTNPHADTYNSIQAADDPKHFVAGNQESKGSVKGFLRRATRLIEKRTGIDATTDGELLIGAVAVKLN